MCPKGADYQWGKDPLEQLMVRFDSYRAGRLGNQASRNLVKKSTLGGRATWQAVTRVKLEQASKAAMWMPTRRTSGEGRADWEEPGAGARHPLTVSTSRATGVVSTACQEGNLRQWGRLGMVGGSRTPNVIHGMTDHLGVGEGQRYRRSRVMPVEGRALASGVLEKRRKGTGIGHAPDNAGQDTGTSDQAVSQGEERAGVPFLSALRQSVSRGFLSHAYELARANHGAPGVDGQSFEDIESRGLGEWMNGLREELRSKTYKPQPVRRVMIPKPGGGERPLGIPTIRDRVAQTAAKLVLEPIWEAELEPNAYGYRPQKSAQGAIGKVDELLHAGYTDVVDADLSKYLDRVSYCPLIHENCSNSTDC